LGSWICFAVDFERNDRKKERPKKKEKKKEKKKKRRKKKSSAFRTRTQEWASSGCALCSKRFDAFSYLYSSIFVCEEKNLVYWFYFQMKLLFAIFALCLAARCTNGPINPEGLDNFFI
jgi:hypothetical protein